MDGNDRRVMHEAIQRIAITDGDGDAAVIYGWVMVIEWVDKRGGRWLSYLDADAAGEGPPPWQPQGYLHNALHAWPDSAPDEED